MHCGGSKFVDPRTFERHRQEIERLQIVASGSRGSRNKTVNVESYPFDDDEYSSDDDEYSSDGDEYSSDDDEDASDGDEDDNQQVIMNRLMYQRDESAIISFVTRF